MSNASTAAALPAAGGTARPVFMQILPLALAVFVGFFMVGLPMPCLLYTSRCV